MERGGEIETAPGSRLQAPGSRLQINIGEKRIAGIRKSYNSVKRGEPLAIFGSSGFLEISVNLGNASEVLSIRKGEKIEVKIR